MRFTLELEYLSDTVIQSKSRIVKRRYIRPACPISSVCHGPLQLSLYLFICRHIDLDTPMSSSPLYVHHTE